MKNKALNNKIIESHFKQTMAKDKDYSFGGAPEWVLSHKKIKFLSDTDLERKDDFEPIYHYLLDSQHYYYESLQSRYFKSVYQVINIKGIEDASSFSISFMPNYEKIMIHEISIKRKTKQIDCLDSAHFRMHQSERVNKDKHFRSYCYQFRGLSKR